MEVDKDKIYGISEFVAFLNASLSSVHTKVIGEVSEIKFDKTGHAYFSLKDEKDGAVLKCKLWVNKYRLFGIKLEIGVKIIAFGYPNIWAPKGELSFIADTIELAGEGDLKKQYDELKRKLEKEGIFNVENKRPLPKYPRNIGIITSKQGAVIHDFLNNIGKFGFKISMIDSRVEGQEAVEDILAAIKTFRKKDIDVLVIIRGGGSMESLMPFNNELLVREIVGFPVPVIAGIGHDKDVPLAAMSADMMVSTPTAAANLISESWEKAFLFVERLERKILANFGQIFEKYKKIENRLMVSLQNFKNNILNAKNKIDKYFDNYASGFILLCDRTKEKLRNFEKIVELNNPERNLKLGYSIATLRDASGQAGKIVRKTSDVKIGEDIDLKVSDGVMGLEVNKITI